MTSVARKNFGIERLARGAAFALCLLPSLAPSLAEPAPQAFPEARFRPVDEDLARLGWLLFYDPILSGNRNIACADCHHPRFATGDGLALGLGEGASGLGPNRRADPGNAPERRIPRNSPALFNLGFDEFRVMFADGRVEEDAARPSGYRNPMAEMLPQGLSTVLAAQAMFPVLSPDEMAGHYSENEVSRAVRLGMVAGEGGAWDLLARRLDAIPAYAEAFAAHRGAPGPVRFEEAAEALAAFMAWEWRADASPFDAFLAGEAALPPDAAAGEALFYGEAGCAACHSGRFQTDHAFHAMAAPQIGPGKVERYEAHARDVGRLRVTGRAEDAYRFRTPSLRNVTRTGPWGHAGAHDDLGAFIADHAAGASWAEAKVSAALPALDGTEDRRALDDPAEAAAVAAAFSAAPVALSLPEIAALLAFLESLTDEASIAGRLGVPETVPSGLPVTR